MSIRRDTTKLEKFANEYFACGNASEAAAAAGYKRGSSLKVTACNLLKHAFVQKRLAELKAKHETKTVLQRDEALLLLTRQARFDARDFVTFVPVLDVLTGKPTKQLAPVLDLKKAEAAGVLDLLEGFEITDKGGLRVKWPDRVAAIDRIGKIVGWNAPEKVEVSGQVDATKYPPGFLDYVREKMDGTKTEGGAA